MLINTTIVIRVYKHGILLTEHGFDQLRTTTIHIIFEGHLVFSLEMTMFANFPKPVVIP